MKSDRMKSSDKPRDRKRTHRAKAATIARKQARATKYGKVR